MRERMEQFIFIFDVLKENEIQKQRMKNEEELFFDDISTNESFPFHHVFQ